MSFKQTSLRFRALLLALFISVAVAAATALIFWIDYKDTEQRRYAAATDVTKVVERHIRDTTAQVDVMINSLTKIVFDDGTVDNMSEVSRWEKMKTACAAIIGCNAIGAINPQGISTANTRVVGPLKLDVSDRAYFKNAVTSAELFIGPAVVTRLPGNRILFHISKAVFDEDNKLIGVIAVAMNTTHFTELYEMMDFSVHPTITVFRSNGDIVARHPDMKSQVGKNNFKGPLFQEHLPRAPQGTYLSHSVLDGKTRLAAYRSLREYDLVIFAGIESDDAFSQWQARLERTLPIVIGMWLLVMAVLYTGYQTMMREFKLRIENRELDALSYLDSLTGIANRRLLDITLNRDWARHARAGTPMSLLMIDIDHFKSFNDLYGHQAGDDVLRRVAQALRQSLHREVDLVARYGGEEFAVILDSDKEGALKVAERMRREVELLDIPHATRPKPHQVTLSIGVATATPAADNDVAAIIDAADTALYKAKAEGRNRVICKSMLSHIEALIE